ncbi:MAG: tetratricopeptide repeat protein, partial [Pseudomonadota bacterium]
MRLIPVLVLLGLTGCLHKKPPEPAVPTTPSATAPTAPAAGTPAIVAPVVKTPEQIALERQQKAREATALLTSGKYEDARRALTLLQELEKDLPESAAISYDLGLAQQQLGNKAVAEQAYRRATQLDPSFGKAWLALGALAEAGGDLGYALTVYGQGMRAAPDDMDLCTARIGVLMRLGRNQEAEAAAKQALQINAKAQSIYANLALIYLGEGRLELGKFIIQRAFNFVEGAENNANLHASLGRIYYLQEHPFEARSEYERALQLNPQLLSAMVYLAELHLDNRAYSSMIPLLEKAVKLAPDDPAIHMSLGIAYRGVQRYDEAIKEYDRVGQLKPGASEPLLNKAILFGDYQKRYDEAMAILEQYKVVPGADVTQADAWIEQYLKEKERVERDERRRKAIEEKRKKREEEERFLKEMEEKKKQEELLRQQ